MDDTDAPIIDHDGNLMQTSYCWLTRCVCVFATVEALVSQPKDANVPGDHDSQFPSKSERSDDGTDHIEPCDTEDNLCAGPSRSHKCTELS